MIKKSMSRVFLLRFEWKRITWAATFTAETRKNICIEIFSNFFETRATYREEIGFDEL